MKTKAIYPPRGRTLITLRIFVVTDNGVASVLAMNSNLVRSACLRPCANERCTAVARFYTKPRATGLPILVYADDSLSLPDRLF